MGITLESREAERFEEGSDSDFQDAEETAIRGTDTGEKDQSETLGPGEIHGLFGSATLRECVERALQQGTVAPATCHYGEGSEKSTNPSHFHNIPGQHLLREPP